MKELRKNINLENSSLMQIDRKFEHICISEKCTILDAMQVIEKGKERLCLVVNKKGVLKRVVSDGDIRRAIIEGHKLTDLALNVHNQEPLVARDTNLEKAFDQLNKWVTLIPVVNIDNKILGITRFNKKSNNIRQRSVAILGLGYVGLTLAVILADNGFSVIGLDRNKNLVKKLKEKSLPFYEDGLQNLLDTHVNTSLKPTHLVEEILADIYIITVGTPILQSSKKPDTEYIRNAVKVIAYKLKLNDLVILRSTVPVGCTREIVIPILEEISGLKAGEEFFVSYCPERTAEGRALKELRELPQIVGGIDPTSRQLSMRFFNENTHTVIDVGSLESAELCKLLDNTYRDAMFGYINQMALLSEKLGLNLKELVNKVNVGYERNRIPLPSPGVGGPCLSKDPYILIDNFESLGLDCIVTSAARKINESAPQLIFDRCELVLNKMSKSLIEEKVFIVGFAFKGNPVTSDLRDSTTLWFLNYIKKKKVKNIWGYDPVVSENELESIGVMPCTIEDGFRDASVVFIMNNHSSYTNLNINSLLETMNKPALFFDGWNMFPYQDLENVPGIHYLAVGGGLPFS